MAPNALFILTDQQRPDTIGALGTPHARTPNLDRLAAAGLCSTGTYVQSTVCVPSRACILTSKYVHAHGVADNGRWIRDDETNWVHDFRRAGYHTAAIGKIHSSPVHHPCGFEHRWVAENKNHGVRAPGDHEKDDYDVFLRERGLVKPSLHYRETVPDWHGQLGAVVWPLDEDLFYDSVVGAKAVDYLDRHDYARPLLLHVGFPGPHDPFDVPASDLEAYGHPEIPEPLGYEGEFDHKPSAQRQYMEMMEELRFPASIPLLTRGTPEKIRRMRRHYYANVMLIDRWVGRLLDKLDEKGQLGNTIVVFTSDHGEPLGDHGMIYKFGCHYEPVVRVPCLWSGPGIPHRDPEPGLAETIDFGPTLLDLCGIASDQPFQGRSLRPLLERGEPVRDAVFSEFDQRLMVREGDWKLVYYARDGEGELYDLAADPHELRNRFGDPSASEHRARLLARLLHWRLG
jgi:arylsulfatase A-like enzyme